MCHMEHIEPTSAQLGIALKEILSEIEMTQEDLSTHCGIPRNSLNRKLTGGVFSFEELTRIAHAVRMPLSEILARAELSARKSSLALADGGAR